MDGLHQPSNLVYLKYVSETRRWGVKLARVRRLRYDCPQIIQVRRHAQRCLTEFPPGEEGTAGRLCGRVWDSDEDHRYQDHYACAPHSAPQGQVESRTGVRTAPLRVPGGSPYRRRNYGHRILLRQRSRAGDHRRPRPQTAARRHGPPRHRGGMGHGLLPRRRARLRLPRGRGGSAQRRGYGPVGHRRQGQGRACVRAAGRQAPGPGGGVRHRALSRGRPALRWRRPRELAERGFHGIKIKVGFDLAQ